MRYFWSSFAGDFFRKLWGPYAGWAHSVSNTAHHSSDIIINIMFFFIFLLLHNYLFCLSFWVSGTFLCWSKEVSEAERRDSCTERWENRPEEKNEGEKTWQMWGKTEKRKRKQATENIRS